MPVIRVDNEIIFKLDSIRNGKSYACAIRELLNLPAAKHNKPRKKRNRLIKVMRLILKG